MSKLTLDALKQRADEIASDELLGQISGGTENACHDTKTPCDLINDQQNSPRPPLTPAGEALLRWINDC